MMNSSIDDEFGANPFRVDGSGEPDPFAPVQQQQPIPQQQFQQPPLMQQQQPPTHQFAQPLPIQQQQFAQPPQQQFAQPPPIQQQQFAQPHQQQFAQPPPIQQQQQIPAPLNPNMPAGLMTQPVQQQQQLPARTGPLSWWGNCMSCMTLDSYKIYFDIDADDIVKRFRGVIFNFYKPEHFRNNIVGPMKTADLKGPDLYGPFWITMTLIFLIGVTANMHGYVHRNDVDQFDYDINHLVHAASILICFVFGLPLILWMTTSCCMAMPALQLVEWLCLYGYSMIPYIPAVILSVLPLSIVAWIMLGGATGVSCLLVIRNVAPVLMAYGSEGVGKQAKGAPIILIMLGCHVVFLFVLKFTFFHYTPASISPTAAPSMAYVPGAPVPSPSTDAPL